MLLPPPKEALCPILPIEHVLRRFEVAPQTSSPMQLTLAATTPDLRLVLFPVSTVAASQWLPVPWPTPEPCTISVHGRFVPQSSFPRSITRSSAARTLSPVDITDLAGVSSAGGGKVSLVVTSESKNWTAIVVVCWCRKVSLTQVIDDALSRATAAADTLAPQDARVSGVAPHGEGDFDPESSESPSDVDLDAGWSSSDDDKDTSKVASKAEEDELCEAGAVEVSLRCPLSYMKIVVPARGRSCEHDAVFDLSTFVSQGVATSTWNCPICNISTLWSDLVLCRRMTAILEQMKNVDVSDVDRVRLIGPLRWEQVVDRPLVPSNVNSRKRTRASSPPAAEIPKAAEVIDVDSE